MKGVMKDMRVVDGFFRKFHLAMVFIAKLMILGMVIITVVQVFCRYVLDFSIRWSEEVPLILMVWFGFISMAIGVKKRLHISIELFFNMFPKPVQKVMRKVVDIIIIGFGLVMVIYGYKLAIFTMTSTLPATKMPTGMLYAIMPLSGLMIVYDTFMNLIGHKTEEELEEVGGESNAV